ncbi:MAG: FAD-binding oxidoreductase [Campylobacteraceae bacterium]|nr:FAD-binding oxidoreductase [Campylobacteraceae bacterium]
MSKYLSLPPKVTEEIMDKAVAEFTKIVGKRNIYITKEEMAPYTKVMMATKIEDLMPSIAMAPKSVEEIQAILEVCNKYKVPVWAFSTGKNLGYGSTSPARTGTALLDLGRMNKILEVNEKLGYALVEPGVTYQDLYDYLKERNIPLWLSFSAPSAIAGPLGNTADRGVGYTPYGEHFMFQCGMEVVLADGQVLRTGMGGIENSNSWQVFKWGYGPYLDGIFTQSNYGIITKMGIWLMPEPPVYKPFSISFPKEEDVVDIVDKLLPLRLANIIPNSFTIGSTVYEAPIVANRGDYHTGPGHITDEELAKLRKEHKLGAWTVFAALYGDEVTVEHNWKIVQSVFADRPDVTYHTEEDMGHDPIFRYRASLMKGEPNLQEFSLYNWKGGGGSMWFAPVAPATGDHTLKQKNLAKKILNKYGLDYVGEFIVGMRDLHHIVDVVYDRTNEEERINAKAAFSELIQEFAKEGYGMYRTNTGHMDEVGATFGFAMQDTFHKIKKALDPNNIIAPGKSGIDLNTWRVQEKS